MKTKKPNVPTTTVKQLDSVTLDSVVGGCACGCSMPNCTMPMAGRRTGWR